MPICYCSISGSSKPVSCFPKITQWFSRHWNFGHSQRWFLRFAIWVWKNSSQASKKWTVFLVQQTRTAISIWRKRRCHSRRSFCQGSLECISVSRIQKQIHRSCLCHSVRPIVGDRAFGLVIWYTTSTSKMDYDGKCWKSSTAGIAFGQYRRLGHHVCQSRRTAKVTQQMVAAWTFHL